MKPTLKTYLALFLGLAAVPALALPKDKGTDAAVQASQAGQWTQALGLWQSASDRYPEDAEVSAELGWAEMQTGRAADARRTFARSLRLQPANLRAEQGLVALAIQDRHFDEAVRIATETARAHPDSALAYRMMGDAQRASSRRSEAEDAYRRAVTLDPSDPVNHASLADALLMRNKADEAIKEYRTASRLAPDNADYKEGLGRATMAGGLYGEAAKSFADAMDIVRRPPTDWARLDTLSLLVIDALGRAAMGLRDESVARQDVFDANTRILAVTDALSEVPAIKDADPTGTTAMAQRAMAYTLMGQAAASELAGLRKASVADSADAVVFREQARRAIVAARAADKPSTGY